MSETFPAYTARLLSLSAGTDALAVLASTAPRIGALVARRPEADLAWTPAPGRWSIAAIVTHLADAEIVAAFRIRMILAAPGTTLQPFDQDEWARALRYGSSDAHASLGLFATLRAALLRLLRGLGDAELDRYGMHAERGQESVLAARRVTAIEPLRALPVD